MNYLELADTALVIAMDTIKYDELYMCAGCLCCNLAIYTDFPDCFGCSQKMKCCCIESTCLNCRPDTEKKTFRCCSSECNIVSTVLPLCKGMNQCCCLVSTCAIPCDAEVPMTLGYCCMCFPKFACCPKQKEMVRA